ncbi:YIP1 family protein [Methanococcoides alaskense]|nr:Yip1 family protein [Methanococcoides alaskense]MDA0524694.1 Yip1 family protein [Methanococcoides alaskense]
MTLTQILKDSNSFFEEKINTEIEFKTPILVMLFIGALAAISAIITTQQIMSVIPEELAVLGSVGIVFGAIAAVAGTLIGWVIYTAIFYILSSFLGGQGDFKRTLEFVAYGFIPTIVSSLLTIYVMSSVISMADMITQDPANIKGTLLADPTIQMITIIGIIINLWSANIWRYGLVHARNMTIKNATIAVMIPIGISILFSIKSLIGL